MSSKRGRDVAIAVMMNGLPGNMGVEVSRACMNRGMEVAYIALTGPGMPASTIVDLPDGSKKSEVELLAPNLGKQVLLEKVKNCQKDYASKGLTLVVVDFTHPSAVNANADIYNEVGIPFVMGTTGGDRDLLMSSTKEAGTWAVIAPNMCKQIVALQATLERMAKDFPGSFSGYSLDVVESHQSGKADTSGTAKAIVASFNKLREPDAAFKVDEIKMIRKPEEQLAFGIPKDHLQGHAYHTYTLKSADETVSFQFQHNVCGRSTYAEGVADAVLFLADRIQSSKEQESKKEKRLFNMIDVLEAGAML